MSEPCGCLSYAEVVELGRGALTYRQLNYWTASGIVRAHTHSQMRRPGSSAARTDPASRTTENRMPYTPGQGKTCGWERPDAVRAVWVAQVVMATSMLPVAAARLYDEGSVQVETVAGPVVIAVRPRDGGEPDA